MQFSSRACSQCPKRSLLVSALVVEFEQSTQNGHEPCMRVTRVNAIFIDLFLGFASRAQKRSLLVSALVVEFEQSTTNGLESCTCQATQFARVRFQGLLSAPKQCFLIGALVMEFEQSTKKGMNPVYVPRISAILHTVYKGLLPVPKM